MPGAGEGGDPNPREELHTDESKVSFGDEALMAGGALALPFESDVEAPEFRPELPW